MAETEIKLYTSKYVANLVGRIYTTIYQPEEPDSVSVSTHHVGILSGDDNSTSDTDKDIVYLEGTGVNYSSSPVFVPSSKTGYKHQNNKEVIEQLMSANVDDILVYRKTLESPIIQLAVRHFHGWEIKPFGKYLIGSDKFIESVSPHLLNKEWTENPND